MSLLPRIRARLKISQMLCLFMRSMKLSKKIKLSKRSLRLVRTKEEASSFLKSQSQNLIQRQAKKRNQLSKMPGKSLLPEMLSIQSWS